ncbi:MAG: lipocalin family protein [Hyphococcus sp.]
MRLIIFLLLATLAGCAKPPVNRTSESPLTTVDYVDLDRYVGLWYEIARLPNSFEKGCEGVTAEYARREDGLISVVNTCRKGGVEGKAQSAKGRARVVDASTNAKLEVSFFGPFWGDYWVIGLADDYSLSLVGEPQGRYLWILSRTPQIDAETRAGALQHLKAKGYNTDALYFTQHSAVTDAESGVQ